MNRIVVGISSFLLSTTIVSAQRVFNPQNARDGETVEYCHQHTRLNELQQSNPAAYQQIMNDQVALEQRTKNYVEAKSGTVYTIPIVFHVLHNGGTENISDEQIYDAVAILNRDYRLLNSDANNVHPDFQGMPTDAEIEFKLATIAPNGVCFKGITRTQSALTSSGDDGDAQLQAIFDGNDVYQGTWAHNRYLNVVIARDIGGAAGYTQYPNNWGGAFSNSIWILHNYVGSIGTGGAGTSRALTHEVGHWLNLAHTWGNSNQPGLASNCSIDDGVTDTPNTVGVTSCNLNENTCGPRANVENQMDYSYCSKMFTAGQVTRMRAAITSATGGRSNIWTTANLNAVGAVANPALCKADFNVDKRVVCQGEAVQFTDASYNTVSGWSWTFQGGTPATSSSENPSITYNTPGTYQVSLTASNGGSTQMETKTAYITVLPEGSGLPFYEGFEDYTNIAGAQGQWFVDNGGVNGGGFEITNTAGNSGVKSVKVNNFPQTGAYITELMSSNVDLSTGTLNDVTLSFRYAYRKKVSNNQEYLKVYFSADCGETWGTPKKTLNASIMSNTVLTTAFTPTSADWKTVHIPFNNNSFSQFLVENFRYKFAFEANGGNNFYLDDINIYKGPESDDIVLGLEDKGSFSEIALFPNPNDGEVNVSFSLETAQKVTLIVMDVSGKELKSTVINGNTGDNVVLLDNSDFASGVYFVQLKTASSNKTLQFVKK